MFRFLKNLFTKQNTPLAAQEVPCDIRKVKETKAPLCRTQEEIKAYKIWRSTVSCQTWKQTLHKEQETFAKSCKMQPCNSLVRFEQMRCCQNFELIFDDKIHSPKDFTYLFDMFRDILLANDYDLHVSEVRTYHCSDTKKETIERHYLKPKPQIEGNKLDQKFGNITLTLHSKSGVPHSLYCRSTHYRDLNLYHPVRTIKELIDCLTA